MYPDFRCAAPLFPVKMSIITLNFFEEEKEMRACADEQNDRAFVGGCV